MSFSGKTCIVTGATSGIGYAIARELATANAKLVLVGRDLAKGQQISDQLHQSDVSAVFVRADLADRSAPTAIAAAALEKFGSIDVLINNAGILINGTALECSDADWDQVIDVNVSAAFRLCRSVLPTMLAQRSGSIVNIASDWALMGARGAVAYCVSKSALTQLTRCLALDYAKDGIRVNAICPGDTDTPMLDRAFAGSDRALKVSTLAETIPMGRVAQVDEIAKMVAFIASSSASFVTGALIPVDGGTSAQ